MAVNNWVQWRELRSKFCYCRLLLLFGIQCLSDEFANFFLEAFSLFVEVFIRSAKNIENENHSRGPKE